MIPNCKQSCIDCICTQRFCGNFLRGFSKALKCLRQIRILNMRLELVVDGGCEPCVPEDSPSWIMKQSNAHRTASLQDEELRCECLSPSCCPLYVHNWDSAPEGKNGSLHAPPGQQPGCWQSCSHFPDMEILLRHALYAHDPVGYLYP